MNDLTLAVEGDLDEDVLRVILQHLKIGVVTVYGKRGKGDLDKRLQNFNAAARYAPWLVLRDLDTDAECAADLVKSKLSDPAPYMLFRIAVHEIEAWLMADRDSMAAFLGLPIARIPANPESLIDPKAELIRLARKSPNRNIRCGLVPNLGSSARQGPGYASALAGFAATTWRMESAARRSNSLARLIRRLRELKQQRFGTLKS
ncbi:MAG: hypothetical protein C4523_01635 [Myxococcales bacterium]|nr:MAG: hypothetical protein C4523_01635 [Myxococcales bacterium]